MIQLLRRLLILACALFVTAAQAFDSPPVATVAVSKASVRALFSPGDDIAGQMIDAISHARRQVLVQAFSFTHDGIAGALLLAHHRGVEVRLIADREQTLALDHGQVAGLARAGIPVWLDGNHQSAHNKVLIIDAGTPNATVITGSFNFTRAAQHKNAENVVFISDNDALVAAYVQNWQRHLAHSQAPNSH